MKIVELQAKAPQRKTAFQCCVVVDGEMQVKNEYWLRIRRERAARKGRDWKSELCQQFGTIMIDDKCYCRKHAGVIALDLWLAGSLVEA